MCGRSLWIRQAVRLRSAWRRVVVLGILVLVVLVVDVVVLVLVVVVLAGGVGGSGWQSC